MTKYDLCTGMVVTLRNGDKYKVALRVGAQPVWAEDYLISEDGKILSLNDYSTELTAYGYAHKNPREFDVMKVEKEPFSFKNPLSFEKIDGADLTWERPTEVKMTLKEIEENFGVKLKIIDDI